MADSSAFAIACEMIEADTCLERTEARGTVRLALKEAGFKATSVSPDQLAVVADRLLPRELQARGVSDPGTTCARLSDRLAQLDVLDPDDAPESLFVRMGQS